MTEIDHKAIIAGLSPDERLELTTRVDAPESPG